jgi:hypothetical protein
MKKLPLFESDNNGKSLTELLPRDYWIYPFIFLGDDDEVEIDMLEEIQLSQSQRKLLTDGYGKEYLGDILDGDANSVIPFSADVVLTMRMDDDIAILYTTKAFAKKLVKEGIIAAHELPHSMR